MSIRVLYVDDEADLREVAVMSLELDPELEVRACSSGAEALEVMETWAPALVLLDLMMPGMDGTKTLEALRTKFGAEPPVAFITARTSDADVSRLRDLGAVDVIAKPFDPMTLAADVRRLLR